MRFLFLISINLISVSLFCQQIDTANYQLDTSFYQNKSRFEFWLGKNDSTYNHLIILRIVQADTTLLFSEKVRDGIYRVWDANGDGFSDFSTVYHYYNVVRLFLRESNTFDTAEIRLPENITTLSKKRKIYFGFQQPYNGDYCWSILYVFKGNKIRCLYLMKFITKEPYEDLSMLSQIKIFKLVDGKADKLITRINIKNPKTFDIDKFQKQYYKKMMHLP